MSISQPFMSSRGWQLMTHPMNSNPWPAAFVNFKATIQLFPVSIPGGNTFLEWRMELLTEQHAAAHMTAAMNDIMVVGLTSKPLPLSNPCIVRFSSISCATLSSAILIHHVKSLVGDQYNACP